MKFQLFLAICLSVAVVSLAKDPKDCEVCKKVVSKVIDSVKAAGNEVTDQGAVAAELKDYCAKTHINKENRFCYYLGATEDAATGLINEMTGPVSRFMPPAAVCSKLKKKDSQLCELQYDEEIDLSTIDLSKQRVKVLKKILSEKFGDACKGCLEKRDFIKRIEELKSRDEL
eukprot:m.74026 g.74026  ORF g.74026 m.74026 type:complete len:172 (-) comp12385_c0_seq1:171-686(-)